MFPVSSLLPVAISTATSVAGQLADSARGSSFARALAGKAAAPETASSGTAAKPSATATPAEFASDAQYAALRRGVEASRQALATRLTARLRQAGVDLSAPAILEVDRFGRVLETGGHLDRDKIERLLESDPELAQAVRRLLRQAEQLGLARTDARDDTQRPVAQLVVTGHDVQLRVSDAAP